MSLWQWAGAVLAVLATLSIIASLIIRHLRANDGPEMAPVFIFGVLILFLASAYLRFSTDDDISEALFTQALIPTGAGVLLCGLIIHDKLFPDE
jgi:drug/metabolite transporter (DMT)-like permease